MKRFIILLAILLTCSSIDSFAQKIGGFGAELSVLSLKMNYRTWVSKTTGFEVFGGIAAEWDDKKPNDYEAGFKYLHALQYIRTDRLYIGVVGKYKWLLNSNKRTTLVVPGFFVGKEWYSKRIHRKGFAIEIGYQFGSKEVPTEIIAGEQKYNDYSELPFILNLRYSFYTKRK